MLAEDVSPDGQRRSDWSLEAFMPNMTSDLPNPFPEDITLEEARQAILVQPGERDFEEGVKKPFPGFRECRKGDCIIVNYDFTFKASFPDPADAPDPAIARALRIRRECRGIIFNADSGLVISRRLHKFFNIGELPETESERVDISRPHVILEKMDGCMVTPFISGGKVRFGSKMGTTEMSNRMEETHLVRCGIDYYAFARLWLDRGFTPIFEYCSAQQQIVVGYEEDLIMLVAMRHNRTGMYVKYAALVQAANEGGIPVVKALEEKVEDLDAMMDRVKRAEGLEGFVLVFQDNGEMFKMKSEWYFERSKKQAGAGMGSHEKDVWLLILENKLDDIAIAIGPKTRERMDAFAEQLFCAISASARKIATVVEDAHQRGLTKTELVTELTAKLAQQQKDKAALGLPPTPSHADEILADASLYYAAFDGKNSEKMIISKLKLACSNRNKLERVRYLAGGLKFNL